MYKGRLHNGEQVAVKVQRPFVLETVTVDLFLVRWVFGPSMSPEHMHTLLPFSMDSQLPSTPAMHAGTFVVSCCDVSPILRSSSLDWFSLEQDPHTHFTVCFAHYI